MAPSGPRRSTSHANVTRCFVSAIPGCASVDLGEIQLGTGENAHSRRRRVPVGTERAYPAFSSNCTLIFWVITISLVTRNSRTFL